VHFVHLVQVLFDEAEYGVVADPDMRRSGVLGEVAPIARWNDVPGNCAWALRIGKRDEVVLDNPLC
jgi:hypothetical protein